MRKEHRRDKLIGIGAMLLLLLASGVQAAEIKGVNFPERLRLGTTQLKLTGVAVLKWALLFDVYAGAFYLPEGTAGRTWSKDVPKRLELSYFQKFSAEDFTSTSDKLLRDKLPAAEYQALAEQLSRFYRLFRDIKPGDRYSLTYRPGNGTELRLNHQLLGGVPGAEFALAYFGLWLGSRPINEAFRDRLLGGRGR